MAFAINRVLHWLVVKVLAKHSAGLSKFIQCIISSSEMFLLFLCKSCLKILKLCVNVQIPIRLFIYIDTNRGISIEIKGNNRYQKYSWTLLNWMFWFYLLMILSRIIISNSLFCELWLIQSHTCSIS